MMTYDDIKNKNKKNIKTLKVKHKVTSIFNKGKTCTLEIDKSPIHNEIVYDVVHVVSQIMSGNLAVTNISKLTNSINNILNGCKHC